jgi:hypothetical protein
MRASSLRRNTRLVPAIVALLTLAACETDPVSPDLGPDVGTITVDAAASTAYLLLEGDSLRAVTVADATASTGWDLALFATTVTTNGGAAGPGGVEVACLCVNQGSTGAEFMAMTPATELADFEGVEAAAAAAATFATDVLSPAISGWYTGTGAAATITPDRSWITREGNPTALLGKFRVVSVTGATAEAMGTVTIEFAVQPAADEELGTAQEVTFAVGATPVYFDLTTGAVTTSANWDFQFSGWTIRVNGGVSGSGTVRTLVDTATPFDDITAAYAATAPVQAYSVDAFGGTFKAYPWYRYNITGTDNQIWPTYDVYLLRRGSSLLKVQLIGYYGSGGEPRQITVRYQRLAQ